MFPFTSKTYGFLKAVALIWLPAAGTLFFTLGDIWSISWTAQAVGSIMATDTFLGVILGISTRSYNTKSPMDGQLVLDQSDPLKDTYSLDLTTPLSELSSKKQITLRVGPKND